MKDLAEALALMVSNSIITVQEAHDMFIKGFNEPMCDCGCDEPIVHVTEEAN
jgi:hypothetical protein